MDQARTLRRLAEVVRARHGGAAGTAEEQVFFPQVKVMSFTSGKGGVGKTHMVVNLAYALRRLGARVMILDADLGLANVDVLLGLAPRFNIQHVLNGQKSLTEVLVEGPSKAAARAEDDLSRIARQLVGRTRCDRIVVFEGNPRLAGTLANVAVNDCTATTLIGQIVTREYQHGAQALFPILQ